LNKFRLIAVIGWFRHIGLWSPNSSRR